MNAPCILMTFIWRIFLPKFKLQLYGNNVQIPNRRFSWFCRATIDFITCSPKCYFCECTWKSGSFVMEKMFCITALIRKTFNASIMLNMLRINIENTTRAKALIEFCLSHRDVARVSNFCTPQYTDNGEMLRVQRVKCTITTKTSLLF